MSVALFSCISMSLSGVGCRMSYIRMFQTVRKGNNLSSLISGWWIGPSNASSATGYHAAACPSMVKRPS